MLSLLIPCFLSKCLHINDVEPVTYLVCVQQILHTVIVLSVSPSLRKRSKYFHTNDFVLDAIFYLTYSIVQIGTKLNSRKTEPNPTRINCSAILGYFRYP
jgi:hypothetical protein